MTRVPPSGGSPKPATIIRSSSSKPAPAAKQSSAPPSSGAAKPKRTAVPKHMEKEKPVKLKTGNDETEAAAPADNRPSEETGAPRDAHQHAKLVESWHPQSNAEKAEKQEAKEEAQAEEKTDGGGTNAEKNQKGFFKQIKPALRSPNSPIHGQGEKKAKDGFEGQQGLAQSAQALKTALAQKAGPAAPVKAAAPVKETQAAQPAPRPSRPPDAFSVLHAAQDPGVFFKEEGHHGAAEQSDPELSAAIEEAIRLLFGVRGILRVSGGFNQENTPAIIVVATQGFGEASMKLIPPKVHRFETILAVPYDMLPLKRERL